MLYLKLLKCYQIIKLQILQENFRQIGIMQLTHLISLILKNYLMIMLILLIQQQCQMIGSLYNMIYYFSKLEVLKLEDLKKAYLLLPDFRKKKVDKYKRDIDKKLSMIAYLLLIYGLKKEKYFDEIPEFDYGKYGKPYIKGDSNIFFNISHCKHGVVCGISKYEIGVDIEAIDKNNISCVDLVMSKKEKQLISKSKFQEKTFTRFWVLKESYVKNSGIGIGDYLHKLDFSKELDDVFQYKSKLMQVFEYPKSFISICSSEQLRFNIVDMQNLFDCIQSKRELTKSI
eukprot:TRINITY_DN7884_c0_g1_i1.p1 TRINITY_DN7884_c0_g1~~TRINITY_DN7884_c0_g1_i1.p1  ORF type:complete len:286 (-),score=28.24 TRINITY_DN7884_c0_g1_i1:439-1296(-)